ncbi:MAG: NADH-quinone oxidoreductase subunit L [Pedosphaera sp.]|nr:NADH-quinone oxidoreductase subunit L [Pedosphaera sp.]
MDAHVLEHAAESGSRLQDLAWMVLFAPLITAAGTHMFLRRERSLAAGFNIAAVALSFVLSVVLFAAFAGETVAGSPFSWMPVAGMDISFGLRLDNLSLLMLLVVTGVALLVMLFSTGYMHEDPGYSRYFCTLSLFVFSMLGVVLADNFVMMFVFWELVGVTSYLLIGFWYDRAAAADAAKKAFLTNRLGDFGFLMGILLIWSATGTVHFGTAEAFLTAHPLALGSMASLAGVLVFMGAMGKSAQFPLHVWLPDAMEGPTPVSALIHAATMVAAGVYMLCRVFFLYTLPANWPDWLGFLQGIPASSIVAWIGGITALLAALIAVQQNDIKRILAYSTLSQLGLMVLAVGMGARLSAPNAGAAMFHLFTHASFKALLFLGAGSVIHACHHEQDIWKMGGLWQRMPVTFVTFLVGSLALMGVPLFSGFYSKDDILATSLETGPILFSLAVGVSALTTFYMSRLLLVAFLGRPRSSGAGQALESPSSMTWPLVILALSSVFAGWQIFGVSQFLTRHFLPEYRTHEFDPLFGPFNHNPTAAMFGFGAVLFGMSLAARIYYGAERDPLPGLMGRLARAMRHRFYFDEIYEATVVPLHDAAAAIAGWIDRWIISGLLVRGIPGAVEIAGRALRLLQTGNLQTYGLWFAAGAVLLAVFTLKR